MKGRRAREVSLFFRAPKTLNLSEILAVNSNCPTYINRVDSKENGGSGAREKFEGKMGMSYKYHCND